MTEWYELITLSDYGWLAQLVPVILILGISWSLSTKSRDMLLIQFPIALAIKMIFPFFAVGWVYGSFALLLIYFYSAKDNFISDIKSAAKGAGSRLNVTRLKPSIKKLPGEDLIEKLGK